MKGYREEKKDRRKYKRADKKIAKAKGTKREAKVNQKRGYDYDTAIAAGLQPKEKGEHWPSRNPETGQILKGRKHPTFRKTRKAERKMGNKIRKGKDGKLYSHPK
jgi:hypothetical protein